VSLAVSFHTLFQVVINQNGPLISHFIESHWCWPEVTITRFYDFDDNKTYVII